MKIALPLLLVLCGCRSATMPVEIPFVARFGVDAAPCTAPKGGGFVLDDLRFYVSDVRLVDASGAAERVELTPDGAFQNAAVALVDLEDGSGSCENGTLAMHPAIVGRVAPGEYEELRFTVGVPFALNHADPTKAAPPLTLGRMHWGWQAGYKFLRFEGEYDQHEMLLHLGSGGCIGTIGAIERCARPNRAEITLASFQPGKSRVVMQLKSLLGADGAAGRCESAPDDASCVAPLAALGIDAATGATTGTQRLFEVSGS